MYSFDKSGKKRSPGRPILRKIVVRSLKVKISGENHGSMVLTTYVSPVHLKVVK